MSTVETKEIKQDDSHDIVIQDIFGLERLGGRIGDAVVIFTIVACVFMLWHGDLLIEVIRKLAGLP